MILQFKNSKVKKMFKDTVSELPEKQAVSFVKNVYKIANKKIVSDDNGNFEIGAEDLATALTKAK